MSKGSKYKSNQRPTFKIWDNEKGDWFSPTYEGWDGQIEELLLNPNGDLIKRNFKEVIHESAFPERYEIRMNNPQENDWQEAIKILEDHFKCEIPRNLDQVIEGFRNMSGVMNTVEFELNKLGSNLTSKEFVLEAVEHYKQKVKVPVYVAELLDYYRESTDVDLLALLITFKDWYYRTDKDSMHEKAIEWLVKRPEKYMRAWLDGYEIEQEPKWVIRSNEDESSYLTEFEITPKHGVRELWGHKYEASQLSDKDLAQYTAYVVDGTAELVEVAE